MFLEVNGVRVAYPQPRTLLSGSASAGPTIALDDVSLSAAAGERVAIIGPNGSGKSTLLSVIHGFLEPDVGTVTVDGIRVKGNPHQVGAAMLLPLFPYLTVRENITEELREWGYSRYVIEFRFRDVCNLLSLDRELLDRKPETLSSGQYQKAALGVALIQEQPLLLLDEPTASLDPVFRWNFIDELAQVLDKLERVTVLYVTHDLEEAARIVGSEGRIVVLNRGKKEQDGSLNEVLVSPSAFTKSFFVDSLRQRRALLNRLPLYPDSDKGAVVVPLHSTKKEVQDE